MPSGRLLVFDEEHVYGFGRNFYTVYAAPIKDIPEREPSYNKRKNKKKVTGNRWSEAVKSTVKKIWQMVPPDHAYALTLAQSMVNGRQEKISCSPPVPKATHCWTRQHSKAGRAACCWTAASFVMAMI